MLEPAMPVQLRLCRPSLQGMMTVFCPWLLEKPRQMPQMWDQPLLRPLILLYHHIRLSLTWA